MAAEEGISVANVEPHMEVARKIRSLESAKISMLQQMAEVHRALQSGSERELTSSLASLIGLAYFLGRQAGVAPAQVERQVAHELIHSLGRDADTADAVDAVLRHFGTMR
jgi:hypothetical protein